MSEQPGTGPGIHEQAPKPTPEIIANPVLENTKLIFSTPLRNEMTNGNLVRHMSAMFRQQLPPNTSIELNYLVNGEVNDDNTAALGFIKKVVDVQKLARARKKLGKQAKTPDELDKIISSENDVLLQDALRLAADRSGQIAVSGINAMASTIVDREYLFSGISGTRTLGMDYATKRVNDLSAVLHLYDIDTVPENNHYSQELLTLYAAHPELTYIFSNLTHLPAGQHKDLVADSPANTMKGHYNWHVGQGSPQITFRLRGVDKLKAIDPGHWQGDEDRDTSYRLVGLFGEDQKDVLKLADSIALPRSLASDRDGGFVDGAGRLARTQNEGVKSILKADFLKATLQDREEVFTSIQQLPPDEQQKAYADLDKLRKTFTQKQQVQSRFNRSVVKTFLGALDTGDIQFSAGKVLVNEKNLLKFPSGKAAFMYVRANTELLTSLSPEDIQLMRYYLDKNAPFPAGISELTPFQEAVREYIGEYDQTVYTITGDTVIDHRSGNIHDKRSLYEPFLAEMVACANLGSVYFRDKEFLERTKDTSRYNWDEHTTWSAQEHTTRSEWMNDQMPPPQPHEPPVPWLKRKIDSLRNRIGYPTGSLLESKLKK